MVEQRNSYGGTEEQLRWNSATMMVEKKNRYSGTVEQLWWKSGTDMA